MIDLEVFWERFGYETDLGCCVCGKKPAKVEPRFVYAICKEHCRIPPAYLPEPATSKTKKKRREK